RCRLRGSRPRTSRRSIMQRNEVEMFMQSWSSEADKTVKLLEALPADQYDFRTDPAGRSLGELAWHLAEVDGYISDGVEKVPVEFAAVPGLTRPRDVKALAPGYRKVHEDAIARLGKLTLEDLDRTVLFAPVGRQLEVRDMLWNVMLHHVIHH